MTILERVRDGRGARIDLDELAVRARRQLPDTDGIDIDTQGAKDAARDVAKDAADTARDVAKDAADTARERFDRVADLVRDVAREAAKAGSDARLDRRLDDITERVRGAVSTDTIRGVMTRLERELPDTDKDRYDRAFERGRVRTRTVYIVGGVAVGIAAGIVAAVLLDPQRGKARRETIARWKDDVARKAAKGAKAASERAQAAVKQARSAAEERGIVKPDDSGGDATTAAKGDMIPVMAVGDRPVTDPSSTVLEPPAGLEGGGLERQPTAIDASTMADATGNREVTTSSHG